jgi:ribosomal protein S18 acetylase RimI-like enzyme
MAMTDARSLPLIVETQAKPEDVKALLDGLSQHSGEATGIRDGELLCIFLRGSDQQVAGGAYGWTWGSACYIRYLFLPKEMRGLGLGTRIMGEVERKARARRCTQIVLETHDFQAPDFYRGLGFVVTGRVEDYPHGHSYLTMVKRLDGG